MAAAHTGAMDINEYVLDHLVRDRLSALRVAARRQALAAPSAPRPGLRVRVWLGSALVHAGEWLRAGAEAPAPSPRG